MDGLNVVYYDGAVKETGHWEAGKQDGLFTLYTTGGILVESHRACSPADCTAAGYLEGIYQRNSRPSGEER